MTDGHGKPSPGAPSPHGGPTGQARHPGTPGHHGAPSPGANALSRSENSTRRPKKNKAHSSKYKVRKHGVSALGGAGPWEGHEEEAHHPLESGQEDEGARRHGRRAARHRQGAGDDDALAAGRKHPSKTIIGKLGMTAGRASRRQHTLYEGCVCGAA